ncbi:hypothetical protein CDAR_432291 [Caerostris darwini]|uniref:Secreted protein n=1 Tax=Caerostris darwini TaxID=1538125 RepID=A0AAV4U2Y5_9ARAC|nr:hypothetical protein CDAR_432291 [Caerostris darwini]
MALLSFCLSLFTWDSFNCETYPKLKNCLRDSISNHSSISTLKWPSLFGYQWAEWKGLEALRERSSSPGPRTLLSKMVFFIHRLKFGGKLTFSFFHCERRNSSPHPHMV